MDQLFGDGKQVACGEDFSLILRQDGVLWGMGRNNFGQLGDGTNVNRPHPCPLLYGVAKVSAGTTHT